MCQRENGYKRTQESREGPQLSHLVTSSNDPDGTQTQEFKKAPDEVVSCAYRYDIDTIKINQQGIQFQKKPSFK